MRVMQPDVAHPHDGAGVFQASKKDSSRRAITRSRRRASLPGCLQISAESDDGEIMAPAPRTLAVEGVNSIRGASDGACNQMLQNFIQGAHRRNKP